MAEARVTIEDVARLAKVSRQTVSRVVNGKGEVSEETRSRVQQVIASLGYSPSAIARSLSLRRSFTVGLVMPDISNPFFPEIARGVEDVARRHGYRLFLCNTDEQVEEELAALQSLDENRVEGVVLVSSRLDEQTLAQWLASHGHVVLVNRRPPDSHTPALFVDDLAGAEAATNYLLELGHRRIAFLMGPSHSYSVRQRLEGYRAALNAAGTPFREEMVVCEAPQVEGGYRAAQRLLKAAARPTALLASNDVMAAGALKACADAGLQVAADVSVMGYDNIPLAALLTPPLTTMNVPKYEMGLQAASLLLDGLDGSVPQQIQVKMAPTLVIRESTGPVRSERR